MVEIIGFAGVMRNMLTSDAVSLYVSEVFVKFSVWFEILARVPKLFCFSIQMNLL